MIHRERDPSLKTFLIQTGLKQLGFDPGEPDNWWGIKSETSYQDFLKSQETEGIVEELGPTWHSGKASSFADPVDVAVFRRAKAQGKSDQEAFKVGDNGIGLWGDDTSEGSGPSCALPPEDWLEKWGSKAEARGKLVEVKANGHSVTCALKDTMPHRANIKNHAIIDLNPDTVKALGMRPPMMIDAAWRWV